MPLLGRHHLHRSWGARLREYALDGLPYVILENEVFRLGFLAGKGADLVEWMVKPLDLDLAWVAPGGISAPGASNSNHAHASIAPDPVAAFMDTYPGGWQTVFPHGSIPAAVHDAPYGLHGEAALLPWDATIIQDDPEAVEVAFSVRLQRIPFSIVRRVRLESGVPAFPVTETVANASDLPFEVNWGQHITFGPPFLEPGCRIVTPDGLLMHQHPIAADDPRRARFDHSIPWPLVPGHAAGDDTGAAPATAGEIAPPAPARASGPVGPVGPFGPAGPFDLPAASATTPGNAPANPNPDAAPDLALDPDPADPTAPEAIDLSLIPDPGAPSDMLYLSGFAPDAWIEIENPRTSVIARLDWDGALFPWCWVWQEFGATTTWPWHGRAFVVGLEPFAGPPPNASLGPAPGREPLRFAPRERKTLTLRARATLAD